MNASFSTDRNFGEDGVRWIDAFPWLPRALKADLPSDLRAVIEPDAPGFAYQCQEVSSWMHDARDVPLSELFPFVLLDQSLSDVPLVDVGPDSWLKGRITTFDDIADQTCAQLEDAGEIGMKSSYELFNALTKYNAQMAATPSLAPVDDDMVDDEPIMFLGLETGTDELAIDDNEFRMFEKLADAEVPVFDAIDTIAQWVALNGDRTRPLFTVNQLGRVFLPLDVRKAIETIQDLTAATWLQSGDSTFSARDFIANFVSGLTDREWRILVGRKLTQPSVTLDVIGAEFNLTRERIRQIENGLMPRVSSWFNSSTDAMKLSADIRAHVGKLATIGSLLGAFPELASSVDGLDMPTWFVFDQFDDTFESDGQWVAVPSLADIASEFDAMFDEYARDEGYIELDELTPLIASWGQDALETVIEWAVSRGYTRAGDLLIGREVRSMNSLAVVALAHKGEPMAESELHQLVAPDRSSRSFANQLAADERIIRTGVGMWALAAWGGVAYAGIQAEIIRRVDEYGEVRLSDIVAEFPTKYGVTENSVRSFATQWPLRAVGNVITRASEPTAPARPVNRGRGVSFIDGGLAYRMTINGEHNRGSGFPVPNSFAGALGIVPGGARTFAPMRDEKPVTIRWTAAQPQVPSIRPNLVNVDAHVGDIVALTFIGTTSNVINLGPLSSDPETAIRQLLVMNPNSPVTSETIARSLGLAGSSSWEEIRALVQLRHENDLLAAIDALSGRPTVDAD